MKRLILTFASAALLAASIAPAPAQQSTAERFFSHNSSMVSRQPSWITPIVEPDPRLVQYGRLSVAHQYTPARTETVNYGNGHTFGVIAGNRFQFNFMAPPYIQNNSATAQDGFGNAATQVKMRIEILSSDGAVIDDIMVPSVIGSSMVNASSGSRLRLAGQDLARVTAQYLRKRIVPGT